VAPASLRTCSSACIARARSELVIFEPLASAAATLLPERSRSASCCSTSAEARRRRRVLARQRVYTAPCRSAQRADQRHLARSQDGSESRGRQHAMGPASAQRQAEETSPCARSTAQRERGHDRAAQDIVMPACSNAGGQAKILDSVRATWCLAKSCSPERRVASGIETIAKRFSPAVRVGMPQSSAG